MAIDLDWMRNLGERPRGGGDALRHADGTAPRDPAAPGVRADPDRPQHTGSAKPRSTYETLLNIKVKLAAEITTYHHLPEEGHLFKGQEANKKFKDH